MWRMGKEIKVRTEGGEVGQIFGTCCDFIFKISILGIETGETRSKFTP